MNKDEYEYNSQKTYYTNTNMNIILDTNIFEYSNLFKYLKIIKSQVTATYHSEDCGYDIKTFL